jgi:hypothetical protein
VRAKFTSGRAVGKNQTVPISAKEATRGRLHPLKIGPQKGRQGAEIDIVGFNGKSLIGGGNLIISSASGSLNDNIKELPPYISPGANNQPPIFYPGGSGPTIIVPTDPSAVTATWGTYSSGTFTAGSGDDLKVDFTFDTSISANITMGTYVIKLTSGGVERLSPAFTLNKASSSQSAIITKSINTQMFNVFSPTLSAVCVQIWDALANTSQTVCAVTVPAYVLNLNTPTISVVQANNGYVVTVTNTSELIKSAFDAIDIWEIESTSSSAPTITYGSDGVTPSNYSRVYFNKINPATIISPNLLKRWIVARFSSSGGIYTAFSTAYAATPVSPVSVDLVPPSEVTVQSSVWSGNDIVINYTLPSSDAGVRFVVQLTPTGVTSPPTGYFYVFPDGTASLPQVATIKKSDLFSQFGDYYNAFSGYFKSIDSSDNRSGGVALTIASRSNPLSGVTPTFSAVGISNGVTLSWTPPAAASYTEVYQKYTSWASSSSDVDYYTATVSSIDISTPSAPKLTLTNIKDQTGATQATIATGYIVTSSATGTIAANSWVTNFATATITLNNALTSTTGLVGSTLNVRSLVYSGPPPAVIQDTTYVTSYFRIKYYDDWHNTSNFSAESTGLSLNPVTADTNPPAATASVTASGGIDTSGVMGFNGYINISFAAVTDSQVRGYRIRYTSDTGGSPVYTYADYGIDQTSPPTGTLVYKLTGLAVGATYQIAVGSYDQFNNVSSYVAVSSGTTITGTPAISNYITAGNFQFGYGIGGVGTQKGLYFDSSNYWYIDAANSARLKVGGASSNYLQWDGTNFTVDGNITARGGSFTGNVLMNGGSVYSGTTVATTISGVVGNGTNAVYTTVAAHGLSAGNVVNIVGLTNTAFNGSYTITAVTSTTPFTFTALNTTTATITTQSGTIYNISAGYVLNSNGLRFNNLTTIDGITGKLTTISAQIANWSITSSKIENTLYGSAGSYSGLSASGTYAFWAGSTAAGGDTNNFAVTPSGIIYAKDIRISGGTLDVGAIPSNLTTGFHVTSAGLMVLYLQHQDHSLEMLKLIQLAHCILERYPLEQLFLD